MPKRRVFTWARSARRSPACSYVASRTWSTARLAISIFVRDGTLLAQGFDLGSLQLANGAFPLPSHGGERSPAAGDRTFGLFSVSRNGILAYAGGRFRRGSADLVRPERQGARCDR